jgi:23S rRNA pseudouridine1911/1915/1917 synthase
MKLDVCFEDDHLLIINKKAGLRTIPDRYSADGPNLFAMLKKRYGNIWVIHRLDKDTSGIICFAKSEEAHKSMSLQFQDRTVKKTYSAIVDGALTKSSGSIATSIAPHPNRKGAMIINNNGKAALTHFQLKEGFKQFSLLEVEIMTGRTHQIRVHLASIHHPLAVDKLYGKREALFLSEIKRKGFKIGRNKEERPILNRQPLHANQLVFVHPASGETMHITASLPKDMNALLKQLRKWGK